MKLNFSDEYAIDTVYADENRKVYEVWYASGLYRMYTDENVPDEVLRFMDADTTFSDSVELKIWRYY